MLTALNTRSEPGSLDKRSRACARRPPSWLRARGCSLSPRVVGSPDHLRMGSIDGKTPQCSARSQTNLFIEAKRENTPLSTWGRLGKSTNDGRRHSKTLGLRVGAMRVG